MMLPILFLKLRVSKGNQMKMEKQEVPPTNSKIIKIGKLTKKFASTLRNLYLINIYRRRPKPAHLGVMQRLKGF